MAATQTESRSKSGNAIPPNARSDGRWDGHLIEDSFAVDLSRPLPGVGGGNAAFAVVDRRHGRSDLMAVRALRDLPPQAASISALMAQPLENVICPVAQGASASGDGRHAWYIICPAPPGPALWGGQVANALHKPWSEGELIDSVLRPVAVALDQLQERGLTHRGIRPDNLFRSRPGQPVTLGQAWAAPHGYFQPTVFEPPYAAQCHKVMRGAGSIADDVYALGVLMLCLALGRVPLTELDDASLLRRKLERGSFVALTGNERLTPTLADLIRNMLAEDPEHRPPPVLLADPLAARTRRVASRPPSRATSPLEVGTELCWDARSLALALSGEREHALRLLRSSVVDSWLRRRLGDTMIAGRVEDVMKLRVQDPGSDPARADTMMVMRAIAAIDPLAPLCWRDVVLFPDGLGTALAYTMAPDADAAQQLLHEQLDDVVATEAVNAWADMRQDRADVAGYRVDSRQHRLIQRILGWAGGLPRLRYALNPLLPCSSRLLGGACVTQLGALLTAMEGAERSEHADLIDREIAAFLAVRSEVRLDNDLLIIGQPEDPDVDPPGNRALAQLRVLAGTQQRERAEPMPRTAAHLERLALPALQLWRSRQSRDSRRQLLADAARAGQLAAMLAVLEDPVALRQDRQQAMQAEAEIKAIETKIHDLTDATAARADQARITGHEITTALGVVALVSSIVFRLL